MLTSSDEYTEKYMQDNGDIFPEASFKAIIAKIKAPAKNYPNLQTYAIDVLKKFDKNNNKLIDFGEFTEGLRSMNINIYTKSNCPNCVAAKQLLKSKGLDYLEIDVELGSRWENLLKQFPDARQMPQVFINDQRVGGLAGLQEALRKIEANAALNRMAENARDLGLEY